MNESKNDNMQDKVIKYLNIDDDPKEVYEILNLLGKGSYGLVYKALHKQSNRVHAIKVIKVQSVKIKDVLKEIEILDACDSRFIGRFSLHCLFD